ncbi:MAG TPA: hypothetical protein PKG48_03575 [Bacteroidales bacterium]|nr:hypothetical protein [Bacteroidales bacterium]HPS61969.1 hypothetical protein [Bacteroidales bacterium]
MNLFYRNRLVFWILVVLAVINLSALVTFFVVREKPRPAVDTEACCAAGDRPCSILQEELGLTGDQSEKVMAINRSYTDTAAPLVAAIKETRTGILNALDGTEPDTAELGRLVTRLGSLQVLLQRVSMQQYSELRKICTPDQAHRLSALYRDLYGCPLNSERGQHRFRHGNPGGKGKCE